MESDLVIGLRLSVIGMGLTFLALGLLILVMTLLLRIFPEKDETGISTPEIDPTRADEIDEQRLEEMAAAIAVGVCWLERRSGLESQDPSLGKLLEQ